MDFFICPPELLTKKHVAYLLSMSEWSVGQLVAQRKLVPVDDGGRWQKFRLEEVRTYIAGLQEWHR